MPIKDYRVTVKVRNNRILKAIEEAGGTPGAKWCQANGLEYGAVNNLIAMSVSPVTQWGHLTKTAARLCDVLGKIPDDLWSVEQIRPLEKNFSEIEMDHRQVAALMDASGQDSPDAEVDRALVADVVESAVGKLPKRQADVIKAIYWGGKTLKEVGDALGISGARVRQIERTARFNLRKTSGRQIRDCIEAPRSRWESF